MPAEQGKTGRKPPPEEHRWPKGTSGNAKGRPPSAGATLKEWLNSFAHKGLTEAQLRRIARDPKAPMVKRMAADRMVRGVMPPLADFQKLVSGESTLEELEKDGVDTAVVKKLKERQELGKEGETVSVTREIELHNLAGEEFDRIADRTDGKPTQAVDVSGSLGLPATVEFITPGTRSKK